MGRPVYQHELINDPDFIWLLESFQENRPEYRALEHEALPIVLIKEIHRDQSLSALPPPPEKPALPAPAKKIQE